MIGMSADETHNMDGVTTMGIMNALRTGNAQIDMVIALCLPLAINFLITSSKKIYEWARKRGFFSTSKSPPKLECRIITYKIVRDEYGDEINIDTDVDTHNSALLKAIRLYLYNVVKLRLKDADIDLMMNEDKSSRNREEDFGAHSRYNTLAGTMSKYNVVPSPPKNVFHAIGEYGDSMSSVELNIAENKEASASDNEENDDGGDRSNRQSKTKETVIQYHFRSADGLAIDDFIEKAFEYYLGVLRSNEDNSRYLLELKVSNDESNPGQHIFKRYRLSEEKTFASLFFQEKDSLLKLIDNFMSRSGRYSIEGYPHKLGLLLHGPPGTGKTSLIKSLAQYTGRSIINVPLSRISTNTELMSIFYSNQRKVDGQYAHATLGFQDVIYVIEDVDASSKIVKRRDGIKPSGGTFDFEDGFEAQPVVESKSIFQMFVESKNGQCKELVSKLVEKSDRLKQELQKADTFKSMTQTLAGLTGLGHIGEAGCNPQLKQLVKESIEHAKRQAQEQEEVDGILGKHAQTFLNMLGNVDGDIDDELVEELLARTTLKIPSAPTGQQTDDEDSSVDSLYFGTFGEEKKDDKHDEHFDAKGKNVPWKKSKPPRHFSGLSSFFKPPPDALNLQGLLNVLDGVIDSPGRIVIMTTNHPEALDPALIRPGRVDKKLFLGFMAPDDVIAMLEHYYQTGLSPNQREKIEHLLAGTMTFPSLQLVPAQLEQLTAEFECADELIKMLELKAMPRVLVRNY